MQRTITFIISCMLSFACQAQVTISSSQLERTKWVLVDNPYAHDTIEFKRGKIIIKDNDFNFTYSSYLTNTEPTSYIPKKTTIVTKGCYLIKYNNKTNDLYYYTISSFDLKKGKMILFHKGERYRIPDWDQYFKYKRIR